jgi:ElaB/YqjD/DUF883 family membrane-anchored ribosome-binding protein
MADTTQQPRGAKSEAPTDDIEALRADMALLRAELEGVVKAVKGLGTTAIAAAKRQHGTAVDHLAAEAQSLAEDVTATGRTQIAELEQRIRGQPLMAVGIAFAVGLLFGGLRR